MTPGGLSLSELTAAIAERTAGRLQADIDGDPARRLTSVAALNDAQATDLSFLANPRYRHDAAHTRAGAVVLAASEAAAVRAANATSLVHRRSALRVVCTRGPTAPSGGRACAGHPPDRQRRPQRTGRLDRRGRRWCADRRACARRRRSGRRRWRGARGRGACCMRVPSCIRALSYLIAARSVAARSSTVVR